MARKIQQYRGLEKDLPRLAEGQIGFTTDTKRTFIGSASGNVELTNKEQLSWVNVKDAPYNAKGDKVTDDTPAFRQALADLAVTGGTLYVPYGNYRITSITIPRNVTFKMDGGVFEYELENWSLNELDTSLIDNQLIKHDNSPVMITCYGHMENVRINGNKKTGIGVDMRGSFNGLHITRVRGTGLFISDAGYEFKSLYIGGNLGDALVWGEDISDSRLDLFNIWSNLGHGCVFLGGNGTNNLTNGKIEWNYKNSVEVVGYTHEITFNNCILDSPTWYNLHVAEDALAIGWKFTGCNFIGGRRESVPVIYGETIPVVPYPNAPYSQIYIESPYFKTYFVNVLFRKYNALHEAGVTETVTHIIGGNEVALSDPLVIESCDCTDFPYDNLTTGVYVYVHNVVSTRFSDTPNFMGGVVTGEIVLPIGTTDNLDSYTEKKQGTAIFNTDDKTLNIWLWGSNYKIRTNQQGKYVSVPARATATGEIGDFSADANYFYICYATNSWRRIAISTW